MFELPTFGVIVGFSQTGVQWNSLILGELPWWSQLTPTSGKYTVIFQRSCRHPKCWVVSLTLLHLWAHQRIRPAINHGHPEKCNLVKLPWSLVSICHCYWTLSVTKSAVICSSGQPAHLTQGGQENVLDFKFIGQTTEDALHSRWTPYKSQGYTHGIGSKHCMQWN